MRKSGWKRGFDAGAGDAVVEGGRNVLPDGETENITPILLG